VTLPVFLVPPGTLRGPGTAPGAEIRLDGDEGRHAATVRRIGRDEVIDLADGAGRVATCVVTGVDGSGLTCLVRSVRDEPGPQPGIVVVQAIPKGDRGEVAVGTLTEVGADVIVPWEAERCVARWRGDRAERGLRRWRAAAREAAKQSRRSWVPRIGPVATTGQVAERLAAAALPVVLHETATRSLADLPVPAAGEVVVVVGPEGGITAAELAVLAVAPVRLGPTVLRTSTAGTVAVAALLVSSQRWR
jgi:16S rRNA (uracil1498-N3)-methyltransferase